MNKTNDHAMDVDMDGASGNLNVEPSTQPKENSSEKIELSDLPTEMLEEILIHLDDRHLLKASHVCKLFASVAEMAFARKYFKKWYRIERNWRSHNPTNPFDKVMLRKYGGKMRKIQIDGGSNEIFELVKQKCGNVQCLKLHGVPRIIMLKGLKEAYFEAIHNLERETFAHFIDINRQLETLRFQSNDFALLDYALLNGRLNNLKTLEFGGCISIDRPLPAIRLRSLETLQLSLDDTTDFVRLLQSMNCNHIKKLVLSTRYGANADDVINEICQFETLVSLGLPNYRITLDQVSKLAAHLPRLTEFVVRIANGGPELAEKILSMTSVLPELSKLEIHLSHPDFGRLSNELKCSANDFHARFAKNNAEIRFIVYPNIMSITTDYLFLYEGRSVELYCMNNLDKKNVRKMLEPVNTAREIKFVNCCADRTFDISALVDSEWPAQLKYPTCLEFKSNGPISVKPNVSRYRTLFPNLRELKIHLEQHSAIDFLRNLDEKFCEQIWVLWLNTKSDAGDPDMTNTLAKFGNLYFLHLGPSFVNIDEGYLFSKCPKLKAIKHM